MGIVYVVGDIHGQYDKLIELLKWDAHVIDDELSWIGQDAKLWFMGDFFNRGPNGIGVIELIMRLQAQAEVSGGRVQAIIGNHDVLFLSAYRFGHQTTSGVGGTFVNDWLRMGGTASDLDRLKPNHIEWLSHLPAMILEGERLFVHADVMLYVRYEFSVEAVNQAFASLLQNDDADAWDALLDAFSKHKSFTDEREGGKERAHKFLRIFGGRQIIHGHTPISKVTQQSPEDIIEPLIYANYRCVNFDGGMYLGGPASFTSRQLRLK